METSSATSDFRYTEKNKYPGLVDINLHRHNLLANLEVLNLDDEKCWYPRGFNEIEKAILKDIILSITSSGTPIDKIKIMEFGPGTARIGKLIIEIFRELTSGDNNRLKEITKNLHSIELIDQYLKLTKETLEPHGVPRENNKKGDFSDVLPDDIKKGEFDLVLASRNNLFYCVDPIEEDGQSLKTTMNNVNDLLKPGGVFLFDTVDIPDDLRHLYSNLIKMYSEATETPNSKNLFRDRDSIDREDYYFRRIITAEEIRNRSQLALESLEPIKANPIGLSEEDCRITGNLWMEMYQMKEWLLKKKLDTLKEQRGLSEGEISENLKGFMETISVDLVRQYTKLYYKFRKIYSTSHQI